MTPYTQAKIMNWLLTICFGIFLSVAATTHPRWGQFIGGSNDESGVMLLAAFAPYLIVALFAFRWPLCPSCKEPTHLPEQGDGGGLLAFIARPRKRDRECGYCGRDLTHNSLPE